MAKSKLYAKTHEAVLKYAQFHSVICAESLKGSISDEALTALNNQAVVVRAAFAEADRHFKDLERRMGPEKTVGDRLKNLKNVFKNSSELAASRKQVADNLEQCRNTFETIENLVVMLQKFVQQG